MTNEIQFILYNLPSNEGSVQGVVRDETIWLTQKAMAQLFGVNVPAISKHLQNIYDSGELNKNATISKMETVVNRGFRGEVKEISTTSMPSSLSAIVSTLPKPHTSDSGRQRY